MTQNKNPLTVLWNFSLAFLGFALAVSIAPFALCISPIIATVVLLRKRAAHQRELRYGWTVSKTYPSGYRRARLGRFAA